MPGDPETLKVQKFKNTEKKIFSDKYTGGGLYTEKYREILHGAVAQEFSTLHC